MDTFVKPAVSDGALTLPSRGTFRRKSSNRSAIASFGQSWLCVGRTEQLEHPGDYFVADISRREFDHYARCRRMPARLL